MTDRLHPRTSKDVFVDAVRDHLNGTSNASHPVQFDPLTITVGIGTQVYASACTLCGSLVPPDEGWKDLHRKNHDDHNKVHAHIEELARQYVMPPRYG